MATKATTLKLLDQALITRYSGATILTGTIPVSTPIEVFMETPNPEEVPERTFPSIAIRFLNMLPDFRDMQHSDDDEDEELFLDTGVSPAELIVRQKATAFRIQYVLDTWHRARVNEDRDLVFETFFRRTPIRGWMPVHNIDGEDISVWVSWLGQLVSADETDTDELIYHKSLTITVLAYIAPVEATDTERDKVVEKFEFGVEHSEDGVHTTDVAFEFDVTSVTRLPD